MLDKRIKGAEFQGNLIGDLRLEAESLVSTTMVRFLAWGIRGAIAIGREVTSFLRLASEIPLSFVGTDIGILTSHTKGRRRDLRCRCRGSLSRVTSSAMGLASTQLA